MVKNKYIKNSKFLLRSFTMIDKKSSKINIDNDKDEDEEVLKLNNRLTEQNTIMENLKNKLKTIELKNQQNPKKTTKKMRELNKIRLLKT